MSGAVALAFLSGLLLGGGIALFLSRAELHWLRGCLQTANQRTGQTHRKNEELLEREAYLETMIEAFLVQYGPEGVTEASIETARIRRAESS